MDIYNNERNSNEQFEGNDLKRDSIVQVTDLTAGSVRFTVSLPLMCSSAWMQQRIV
jgi:hypothetical protein